MSSLCASPRYIGNRTLENRCYGVLMRRDDHLYFMLNAGLGIIKIGISNDVDSRRVQLEHACGVTLDVLRIVDGGADYEQDVHDAFGPCRLRGEWFAPTPELLELAYGDEKIETFLNRHRGAIIEYRAARDEMKARQLEHERARAREERDRVKRLREKEKALKAKREAAAKLAKEKAAQERREWHEAERERHRETQRKLLAESLGLPVNEAARVAKDRREAVAQRARNSTLLGLRRTEIIDSIDTRRKASQ